MSKEKTITIHGADRSNTTYIAGIDKIDGEVARNSIGMTVFETMTKKEFKKRYNHIIKIK